MVASEAQNLLERVITGNTAYRPVGLPRVNNLIPMLMCLDHTKSIRSRATRRSAWGHLFLEGKGPKG